MKSIIASLATSVTMEDAVVLLTIICALVKLLKFKPVSVQAPLLHLQSITPSVPLVTTMLLLMVVVSEEHCAMRLTKHVMEDLAVKYDRVMSSSASQLKEDVCERSVGGPEGGGGRTYKLPSARRQAGMPSLAMINRRFASTSLSVGGSGFAQGSAASGVGMLLSSHIPTFLWAPDIFFFQFFLFFLNICTIKKKRKNHEQLSRLVPWLREEFF
jgi:hypothetical protein